MQDNTAYNMAQLNKYASSENVYDTPRREDVKSIAVHKTKKGRFRVGCFALLSMFAITFATTAVLLSLVQLTLMLTQEKEMQEAMKEAIDAFRFEYSSTQGNISDQLKELLDLIKASSIQLSTTMTTAATITTTTSSLEVCGGPGWRRIAFINMTDPNQNCPQGLALTDYSIRSCGRTHTENLNCSSVTFTVDVHHTTKCVEEQQHIVGEITLHLLDTIKAVKQSMVPMWMDSVSHMDHQGHTSGHSLVAFSMEPVKMQPQTFAALVILETLMALLSLWEMTTSVTVLL